MAFSTGHWSWLKSAIASLSLTGLPFTAASPSGAAVTATCVSAKFPLGALPGPFTGRLSSVNTSSRSPVIFASVVLFAATV